jgi:hypothetical protein
MLIVNVSYPSPYGIRFPQACACCLAATSDHRVIPVELGHTHSKDKWHEDYKIHRRILDLKVPYCKSCTAHAAAYEASGLLMIASVLHILTLGLFYLLVTKPLLEPFVQRSIRKQLGHASCGGMQGLEVVRVGDDLRFSFAQHEYAQHFMAANQSVAALAGAAQLA